MRTGPVPSGQVINRFNNRILLLPPPHPLMMMMMIVIMITTTLLLLLLLLVVTITTIIIIINIIITTTIIINALKGANSDFLLSPHCAAKCLQLVRAEVAETKPCANHVQHIVWSSSATCVPRGMKGELSYQV